MILTLVEVTVAMLLEEVDVTDPVAAGRTLVDTPSTHTILTVRLKSQQCHVYTADVQ